jgi:hypothetical protein
MPSPRFNHGFENDVFLSYCHKDDEPDPIGRRWITKFESDLRTQLEMNSGRTVRIWRDRKLNAADRFDQEIRAQLLHSAILVPIITPSYMNSEHCDKEWRQFLRSVKDIGNTTRMVKVAKTFVPWEDYPREFSKTNQHSFFVEESNGTYREYHLHPDLRYEREYAAHVDDVAQEVKRLLTRLEGGVSPASEKGIVFVAETSSDLNPDRDRICRLLEQLRYEVRPKTRFFGMPAPEIRRAVARDLAASRLAILPVGARYGAIPELGGGASVVRIQLEVAARDRRNGTFPRLVWMPKGLEPAEPEQSALLKEIRETWARKPFEVLELLPHQFEEVLEERLNPRSKAARPSEPAGTNHAERPSVYVLAEPQDVEASYALRRWLFDHDFDVPGPPENWTDPAVLREELRRRFAEDHAFLVYYGQSNEGWVWAQMKEISKAAGRNRTEPILARAVFLADPETPGKKKLLLHEATLLKGFAPIPLNDSLAPFAAEIRKKWADRASGAAGGGAS